MQIKLAPWRLRSESVGDLAYLPRARGTVVQRGVR